jgi:HlyD family secretion protein
LASRNLIARADADTALTQRDAAHARVASARAAVAQRQAHLASAELELERTVIRAPVDGVVLLRQAQPGQTVAASFQTPVLFRVAEDLAQMQIDLAVDESSVGQITPGMLVRFTVDTFRDRRFIGTVEQVRLAATNNQNVMTYPVVNVQVIAIAALFSIGTGLFFGYYPARRASMLDPIEALRHG